MTLFETSSDGYMREVSIREMVEGLKQAFPEIDSPAMEAALIFERSHSLLANLRVAYWANFNLTPLRFGLLRLLYLADGQRMAMSDIAANLHTTLNSITQLIDGVVKDGLVQRAASPEDKRVNFAVLTPEGEALFASAFPQNAKRVSDAWAGLADEEKMQLIHLLARLRANLLASE